MKPRTRNCRTNNTQIHAFQKKQQQILLNIFDPLKCMLLLYATPIYLLVYATPLAAVIDSRMVQSEGKIDTYLLVIGNSLFLY